MNIDNSSSSTATSGKRYLATKGQRGTKQPVQKSTATKDIDNLSSISSTVTAGRRCFAAKLTAKGQARHAKCFVIKSSSNVPLSGTKRSAQKSNQLQGSLQ